MNYKNCTKLFEYVKRKPKNLLQTISPIPRIRKKNVANYEGSNRSGSENANTLPSKIIVNNIEINEEKRIGN